MKEVKRPVVSVVVPVYNTEPFLAECLHSLEKQTLTDIEIILVNDGSTDNSGEVAAGVCG
ncbi:glycosyltransferase family 2 protein [Bacteroides fragilis]|nr:glycosyltransferase family 2 protein [Bacteroides fragilis]